MDEQRAELFLEQLKAECQKAECQVVCASGGGQDTEAIGESLQGVISLISQNFDKIDRDEAEAILAKLTEAVTAFVAGAWLGGTLAMMQAISLYRKALQS